MKRVNLNVSRILSSERGLTLVEMMVVLVIMTLASSLLAVGVPSAINAYKSMVDASNAEVVLSTSLERLRAELLVADTSESVVTNLVSASITENVELATFQSADTGYKTSIIQRYEENEDGTLVCKGIYIDRATEILDLIPDSAKQPSEEPLIPENMQLGSRRGSDEVILVAEFKSNGGISYDSSTHTFTISGLEVVREGESDVITEQNRHSTGEVINIKVNPLVS